MSLTTELSGVQAAQGYIDTIGNNLANVNTTGFKLSDINFADLYAAGLQNTPGQGVLTSSLAQSFTEGTVNQTGNALDVAIDGNGFFQLATANGTVYSRDGSFLINSQGELATAGGGSVLGYAPTASGSGGSGSLQPIRISTASIPGSATSKLTLDLNLPSTDTPINTTTTPFSVSNPSSYNQSTSTVVYDSLGTSQTLTTYYTEVAGSGSPPQWQTHWSLTNANGGVVASGAGPSLTFNSSGQLVSGGGTIAINNLPDGAAPLNIAVSYTGSSISNLPFGVASTTNNGAGAGQFGGVTIGANGQVTGQYSNGGTHVFGTIALANFANPQGLVPMSGNVWTVSSTSGAASVGAPGSANLGLLQGGALESSNVDLSSQLVNLIVAQQAYQANVQSINIDQQDFHTLTQI
jgi:flagellar hook protein FlgE